MLNGETPPHEDALLERDAEVASLDRLIDAVVTGEAGLALVEGPAGIGKTRLVSEARRRAADAGLCVLSARSAEIEREFPFGVVRQLFESEVTEHALKGAAHAARPVFESGVGNRDGEMGRIPSFASLHGLYWLAVNLSLDRPLLVAVDDLHWCDRASLRFLSYLVRRIEGLPVLMVCSLRPLLAGGDAALVGEIASDPLTVALQPRPLSESAVAHLVRERLRRDPAPAFSVACHTATGGNPLLLHELLRTLATEGVQPDAASLDVVTALGPRAISRAVFLRLARLPQDALLVANALAILGDGVGLATLAALAGLTEQRTAQCVTTLTEAEILRADLPIGFVHPLVGSAIRGDIPPAQRVLQHERAATLLSASGAPSEQVAAQLVTVPGRGEPWVLDTLRRAARGALSKGAAESAVTFLTRAATEPPPVDQRADVLLELGRAETLTSGVAAAEHLSEAYHLLDDPVTRANAAEALARARLFTGHPQDGAAVARDAAAALPSELEDVRKALEAFQHLALLFGAGDPDALQGLKEYRTQPVGPGVGAKMLAAVTSQDWMYACGPSEACTELARAALVGGELIAADNGLLATCAITTLVFADREEALDWWDVARVDAHRRGSLFAISSLHLWYGFSLYYRGELREAEDSLRMAIHELALWSYGHDQAQIYCDAFLSAVLRERGDLHASRDVLELSGDPGGTDDGSRYWLNSQVELLLAENRNDEALAAAEGYERRFAHKICNPMDAPWRSNKARALDALGHRTQARGLVEEELELAHQWGGPSTIARSLRALARLSPAYEVEYLREAVTAVAESPAKLELAKALAALGGGLRRARQPRDAREPLRTALELAHLCGAVGLADQTRTELYAAGGRPRPATLTGIESLTASERRVAALAAGGAINPDIARELFVTPKTVEAHLSSVYRKLGIRSRHELPRVW